MRFQNKQIFLLTVWTNRRNPSHKLINSNDLIVTDGPNKKKEIWLKQKLTHNRWTRTKKENNR